MLQVERWQAILKLLDEQNNVTVAQLCEALSVSDMTIRRDLREMDSEGLLRRVHGGAVKVTRHSYEPPFALRQNEMRDVKQRIGRKAAELIKDGDSISLDVGTTTLAVACSLHGRHDLTVLTASLPIAYEISNRYALESDIRLIVTGGVVRRYEHSMVGYFAERLYEGIHIDKAFIGVGGLNLTHGLTEFNLEDAAVKRAMLANADQVIVVADSSKFNRRAFATFAPLSEIDVVVTDHRTDPALVTSLQDMGIEVLFADEETTSRKEQV
jgi:DeoR/GlpR family transcriptional regulator of sugar metabolism